MLDQKIHIETQKEIDQKAKAFWKAKTNKNEVLQQSSEKEKLLKRKKELEELENAILLNLNRKKEEKLLNERNINEKIIKNLRNSYPL